MISPNFIYAFILTRSSLGLMHAICRTFRTRVMALDLSQNFVSAHYLENILIEFHQIYICIHIDKIYLGIVTNHFSHICTRVMVPDFSKILFPFNILRTNGQNFAKFYICIHIDTIYIGIVTHHFLHICTIVMALDLCQNFVSVQYLEKKLTEFHQIFSMQSY